MSEKPHLEGTSEIQKPIEREKSSRTVPTMFVSAPHIEGEVTGTFAGEPTPLLYALSVTNDRLNKERDTGKKIPTIERIYSPGKYSPEFEREFREAVKNVRPRVIGISNTSEGHFFAIRLAQQVKEIGRENGFETIIVFGGSHEDGTNPRAYAKLSPKLSEKALKQIEEKFTLKDPNARKLVDIVVAGDGPHALDKILEIISENSEKANKEILQIIASSNEKFSKLEGDGNVFLNTPDPHKNTNFTTLELSGTPLDWNRLPNMFRDPRLPENKFVPFGDKKTAQIMTSMGCKYRCEFCQESVNLYKTWEIKDKVERVRRIKSELTSLYENGYRAVFFDDSTFAQDKEYAEQIIEVMTELQKENKKYEWGCQTTFWNVDDEILQKMKNSGCSYIYFGFEQLEEFEAVKKFGSNKEKWTQRVESVLASCEGISIRAAVSIQLGLRQQTEYKETLDYVAHLYKQGLLYKGSVALNINVPFPGTEQWNRLAEEGQLSDFNTQLVRHPRFETAHNLANLNPEQVQEIYAYASKLLGDGLMGIETDSQELRQLIDKYRQESKEDFYLDDDKIGEYLQGSIDALYLNHASLTFPNKEMAEKIRKFFESEKTEEEKTTLVQQARKQAADLIGLGDPSGVAFGRNTTEALSYCFWLAGLKKGDNVLLTNAENRSIQRIFEMHMDHGNPNREDKWSAWPTYYTERGKKYGPTVEQSSGVDTTVVDVINNKSRDEIFAEIQSKLIKDTKVLVISHVIRDNGRVLPITEICQFVREIKRKLNPDNPDIFIVVDGAQALGNLERIEFDKLGCDAYVATPHKTMGSTPLGLLFFNPDNPIIKKNILELNRLFFQDQQVLLGHAFSPSLGVRPNVEDSLEVADIFGFQLALDNLAQYGYEKGNFQKIAERRKAAKNAFREMVTRIAGDNGLQIQEMEEGSSFIFAFNIIGIDNKRFAEELSQNNVFVSYINRTKLGEQGIIRASFDPTNTPAQMSRTEFIEGIKRAMDKSIAQEIKDFDKVIDLNFFRKTEDRIRQNVSATVLWLKEQTKSPIMRIAAAAVAMITVLGTVAWLSTGIKKEISVDEDFLSRKRAEIRRLDRQMGVYRENLRDEFHFGSSERLGLLELEEYKYKLLVNINDEKEVDRILDDETTVIISTVRFSDEEKEILSDVYNQTHNQKIGKLIEMLTKRG